jgi:hypothetical protein
MRSERGQAVPLVAGLIAVAGVLVLGIGVLAGDVADAGRARSAADAAALAGVRGGRTAAAQLAAANDATLVRWQRSGNTVLVTVRVGDAVADARATAGADDE